MPVTVSHSMLVNAFEYAIEETRKDGINVVDNLIDWRNNYGSSSNRITKLYGAITHHTGSEISASGVTKYVRGLGSGSLRPEIGKVLCNTATVRTGVWPSSGDKPTIVVLSADYTNNAGLGDQGTLNELDDGDVDISGEIKPGADDLYVNRYFFGDEGVGSYTDASQQRAFVVFYSHLLWKLGLLSDVDHDGKFAPIIAHRESTKRKVDPSRADLGAMRQGMQEFVNARYYGGQPPAPVVTDPLSSTTPLPFSNPYVPVSVDGLWGNKTTKALQYVLKEKYGAWGLTGPLVIDGMNGKNTYRALQRVLNQQIDAKLAEDGQFGPATKRALQRYVGASEDGIIGPVTIRNIQSKINNGF